MPHFARSPLGTDPAAGAGRRAALARLAAAALAAASLPAWGVAHRARAAATGRASALGLTGEALLRDCGVPSACMGAYARAIDATKPLVAVNAESAFAMASTTKVVTSLAALDLLGVDFRWRTFAFLQGPLVDGTLLGDLLIVGGGDARLRAADLRTWFGTLRDQGLKRVAGDIVLDRHAFALNESDFADTPPPTTGQPYHVRPDALAIDEGVLHVEIEPARGGKAIVSVEPPLAGVPIDNRVTMRRAGCGAWVQLRDGASGTRLEVSGAWSAACGHGELPLVPGAPAQLTTRALAGLWADVGGHLGGRVVERAPIPGGPPLPLGADGTPLLPWSVHVSEPLPVVLHDMNKTSDNLTARHLMLALARGFPLRAATLADAQARMHDWLLRQGFEPGDIEVENGAGLSRAERARPRALARLLENAWRGPQAREFVDSLPVAGLDGTLEHRMQGSAAAGHAFLKTGTLDDTRALAGYVEAASGKTYVVALMVNHPDASRATPALDRFIEWLARSA